MDLQHRSFHKGNRRDYREFILKKRNLGGARHSSLSSPQPFTDLGNEVFRF